MYGSIGKKRLDPETNLFSISLWDERYIPLCSMSRAMDSIFAGLKIEKGICSF